MKLHQLHEWKDAIEYRGIKLEFEKGDPDIVRVKLTGPLKVLGVIEDSVCGYPNQYNIPKELWKGVIAYHLQSWDEPMNLGALHADPEFQKGKGKKDLWFKISYMHWPKSEVEAKIKLAIDKILDAKIRHESVNEAEKYKGYKISIVDHGGLFVAYITGDERLLTLLYHNIWDPKDDRMFPKDFTKHIDSYSKVPTMALHQLHTSIKAPNEPRQQLRLLFDKSTHLDKTWINNYVQQLLDYGVDYLKHHEA